MVIHCSSVGDNGDLMITMARGAIGATGDNGGNGGPMVKNTMEIHWRCNGGLHRLVNALQLLLLAHLLINIVSFFANGAIFTIGSSIDRHCYK
jgi:hypothetical protein